MSHRPFTSGPGSPIVQFVPDDAEASDLFSFREPFNFAEINRYLDKLYPAFEPEVVHSMSKDYFLPALKVLLVRDDTILTSPGWPCVWDDWEARAVCHAKMPLSSIHPAPDPECDCGIYGSVNLEEVDEFLLSYSEAVLCIVEPSEGADVILCRKGWKASHVFVSEIVGDTISVDDASNLLSLAWKRKIDVGKITGRPG